MPRRSGRVPIRIEGMGRESLLVGGKGGALGDKGGALGMGSSDDKSGSMPHNGARGAERLGSPPTADTISRPPSGGADEQPVPGATLSPIQRERGRLHIAQIWCIIGTCEFLNSVCGTEKGEKVAKHH